MNCELRSCDMNSTLGSVVPLAMLVTNIWSFTCHSYISASQIPSFFSELPTIPIQRLLRAAAGLVGQEDPAEALSI